jgi:hypothetical protein
MVPRVLMRRLQRDRRDRGQPLVPIPSTLPAGVPDKYSPGSATFAQDEAVVAVAGDIAQAAVLRPAVRARSSRLIAAADHALRSGQVAIAVSLLGQAAK